MRYVICNAARPNEISMSAQKLREAGMATTYSNKQNLSYSTETSNLQINQVDSDQALAWIEAGWNDFLNSPGHSLLYGLLFSLCCIATIYLTQQFPGFVLSFLTGLMLIGPLLAVGAYTAAWQLKHGYSVSIREGIAMIRSRATNLGIFTAVMLVVLMAWIRLSSLLFAIQFQLLEPSWSAFGQKLLSSTEGWLILGFFIVAGFFLAAAVFILSATSIPMIIDRNTSAVDAVQASYHAVMANKKAMSFWAFMIVVLCGIGITTGFVLMTVIFPVLGYATWHSYQDLLKQV
ncbi:MAG: DUF2189 domain-containing protein [Halopseudomonas sp.]